MNSYDFFIYEFMCFMNSYMNSGVPRFQMMGQGLGRPVQDYVRKRESAGVAGAGLKIEGASNGFQESSAHLDSTDRPLGTHVRIRRRDLGTCRAGRETRGKQARR